MLILALSVAACGGSRRVGGGHTSVPATPTSTVEVGQCADPDRDGVVGDSPRLERRDKDLNGDGTPELVVVDRNRCTSHGNCHWNVFAKGDGECRRYVGTFAAAHLEPLRAQGDDGFRDVRAWWRLSGDRRVLLQHYRFRHGGYEIIDAFVCRQQDDDRLLCAEQSPRSDAGRRGPQHLVRLSARASFPGML